MNLLTEIHDIAMFFQMLLFVGIYTGSIFSLAIVIGYELQTKRRMP